VKKLKIIIILLFFLPVLAVKAQDRFEKLKTDIEQLSLTTPALNEKVNISVSRVSIQEFIRAVANNAGLNINVDPSLDISVINNFSDVTVKDMVVFLSKEYDLDVNLIGNIISISKFIAPPEKKPEYKSKKLLIDYTKETDQLSIDLANDSLARVTKEITKLTGKNIVLGSAIQNNLVSGYIEKASVEKLLDKLAFANDLTFVKNGDFYVLDTKEIVETGGKQSGSNRSSSSRSGSQNNSNQEFLNLKVFNMDSINIDAVESPVSEIIKAACQELNTNFTFLNEVDKNVTLRANGISFDDMLYFLLNGTDQTFKKLGNVYMIGQNKIPEMRAFKVIELQYRTVEKLLDIIPAELKQNIEIKEFIDLNSLLVNGPMSKIQEIEEFVRQIDKVVPVILIEVMIVDVKKSFSFSTGVEAGLGENPSNNKQIWPGVNYSFDSKSINNLLNSFTGFGSLNLGQVTPEFYMNLKALETNQIIKLRSTPKLSTLNGHEASIKLTQTDYYVKENISVSGTLTSQTVQSKSFESVTADFSVTIKPIVSADEYITLEIQVTQSDFTGRSSSVDGAPPGQYTRDFKSLIRVKNEEVILLGGLEDKKTDESGSGVPFLSRIPVIRWFFSSRTRGKSSSKLTIFIKPTVIY